MDILTQGISIPSTIVSKSFDQLRVEVEKQCGPGSFPLRFTCVANEDQLRCEVETGRAQEPLPLPSIFEFRQRAGEWAHQFIVAMLIPTGIDCAIGGHAGDATPAARTLAAVCDHLIIHPNVVNASDVNQQPENSLYVEGSLICRLLMGTIGLRKVRKNRILLITEPRKDGEWVIDQTVNTVSAARATLGVECDTVLVLDHALDVRTDFADSGRAIGRIGNLERLIELLLKRRDTYDVVALATRISPHMDSVELHQKYFNGESPNPWGGAEAALTHTLSTVLNVPTAHAPTMSDLRLRTEGFGQVDPRKAAEIISMTYLMCVLEGLHRAPAVVPVPAGAYNPSELHAEDVAALVIPDGCLGLPVLAALRQGVTVIAVRENTNLMRNDLSRLPWAAGQFVTVGNYFEAAGVLAAIRAGVALSAHQRPMVPTYIERLDAPLVDGTQKLDQARSVPLEASVDGEIPCPN